MRHLSGGSFVDAIEGRITEKNARHLEACSRCREELAALQSTFVQVGEADTPEPPPLFWDTFRARVLEALDPAETRPRPSGKRLLLDWLTAATITATLMLVVFASQMPQRASRSVESTTNELADPADVVIADDIDADEAWALVRSMADELDYDAARDAGVTSSPGALERAALELSTDEQTVLIELIEEEIRRSDS